jgi:hypothetical protein
MRFIDVEKKGIKPGDYRNRSAKAEDCAELVSDSCVLKENGEVKLIYVANFTQNHDIVNALQRIQYRKTDRSGGLVTNSRIFGWSPRVTHRKDFCSGTSLLDDFPREHGIIADYAKVVEAVYRELAPTVWLSHRDKAERIKANWHLPESVYTSGIINKDNPLNYHFDSGNIPATFSSMLVFKKDVDGGHLNLPDYGFSIECADSSLVVFDGQGILHGVTPIEKKSINAFRYSVVFYTLQSMWNCLNPGEELARIRETKAKRENGRYLMATGQMDVPASLRRKPRGLKK